MKNFLKTMRPRMALATFWSFMALSGVVNMQTASAAITDIAQSPVASSTTAIVKPNIMLLMDTSASMGYTHMPDEIEGNAAAFPIGYRNYQCNALYYNPNKIYTMPKDQTKGANGDDPTTLNTKQTIAVPTLAAAYTDYYLLGAGALIDLTSKFSAFDRSTRRNQTANAAAVDAPQAAYYFVYTGPTALSYKAAPCTDADTTGVNTAVTIPASDGGTWTRKLVSTTSGPVGMADETQNFAIWYSFYRTRLALTKSGVTLAFTPLSKDYRVGFTSMNPTVNPGVADSPVSATKYLALDDFQNDQRRNWFAKLFSQTASGSSPAREGLARIGRLYAGKSVASPPGINANMGPDPVQYSCQQNFTIMTTDGYWNTTQEGRGPVGLDGTTLVGQQDGTLTDNSGLTPRPIWDGGIGGSRVTTDKSNKYTFTSCEGGYYMKATTQIQKTTTRLTQSTSQTQQTTSQVKETKTQITKTVSNLIQATNQLTRITSQPLAVYTRHQQTTHQYKETRSQIFSTDTQIQRTTEQLYQNTQRWVQRTFQNTSTTSYLAKRTSQTLESDYQQFEVLNKRTKSTSQRTSTTLQVNQATSQPMKRTTYILQSTSQFTKVTSRTTSTTTQTKQSTVQNLTSTSQLRKSTSQLLRATSQRTIATSQLVKYSQQTQRVQTVVYADDGANETSTPVMPPCTGTSTITCRTDVQTDYVATPAACVASPPNFGNDYTKTECNTNTSTKVGVSSCTAIPASSGNNYSATVCETITTPPTGTASCTNASAQAGNNYVQTTCNTVTTPATGVASCTGGTDANFVVTTCTTATSGPTGVGSCTGGTDANFVVTTCDTNITTSVPSATCTPGTDANFIVTTCAQSVSGPTPVATCTTNPGTTSPFIKTTCDTVTGTPTLVASCTPVTNPSSPYVYVACNTTTDPAIGIPTACTPVAPVGPGFVRTACPTVTTTNVQVGSCTPSGATSTNQYVTTTCPTPTSDTETFVAPGTCVANTSAIPNVSCRTDTTGPTLVATCTANPGTTTPWKTTTCTPTSMSTGTIGVQTCTDQTPTMANNFVKITCASPTTGPTAVDPTTCPLGTTAGDGTNSWVTTTCTDAAPISNAVLTCSPSVASAPLWTARTCAPQSTTNVPVSSCTANPGSASPYKKVTCTPVNTGPVADASCVYIAPTAINGYTTTTCTPVNSGAVGVGTCVPQTGNTTVVCGTNNSAPTYVQNCSPQVASSTNLWTTITCENQTTTNVLVDACTPIPKSLANNWLDTTCNPPVRITTNTALCTPEDPGTGNNHTRTTCATVITTASHAVPSCTGVVASPPNYITTTCDSTDPTRNWTNKEVLTCTDVSPSSGNGYLTVTCSESGSGPTFVETCTPGTDSHMVVTSCSDVVSAPTPIVSCVSPPAASSTNNWATVTSCNVVTSGATGVQTCAPGTDGNFVTTTCPNVSSTGNVATCTAGPATADNQWVMTTCTPASTSTFETACTPQTGDAAHSFVTITCNTATVQPTHFVQTCTAGTGANNIVTTCDPVVTTVGVQTCNSGSPTLANDWTTTTCTPVNVTNAGVASCTPSGPSSGNGFTTTTCGTPDVHVSFESACATTGATLANNWTSVACQTLTTGPVQTTDCTAGGPTLANNFVGTTCTPVIGEKVQYQTTTTTQTFLTSGTQTIGAPTNTTTSVGGISDVDGVCHVIDKTTYTKPVDGRPTGALPPVATCAGGWPCSVDTLNVTNSGSNNSLADVAQYYYVTDLRPDMANDVVQTGSGPEDDRATWQHMTTFAIGLGVSGTLNYNPNYKSASTGDFADIRTGLKNWPAWPDASINYASDNTLYNDGRSIDDFWHAAVNGRGRYFSANDPDAVVLGLRDALAGIKSRSGAGSSVTLSTPTPSATDNTAFITSFTSEKWTGNLEAYSIDIPTGNISNPSVWSAQGRVDAQVGDACDLRKIYTFRSGNPGNLGNFTWNTKACAADLTPSGSATTDLTTDQMAMFGADQVALYTQALDMTDAQKSAAAGANLVNFLRGQRGKEGYTSNDVNKLYRSREHVLGDIIDSQVAYVKEPSNSYQDADYTAFKATYKDRAPMAYVGGNDGMLHAFNAPKNTSDANAGKEAWAFVPTPVMKNMYLLADTEYGAHHIFSVDGSPVAGDFYDTTAHAWKTMLVGGLGAGGNGYYALDVTDPTAPKAMWEFTKGSTCFTTATATPAYTDCDLGLTFGKPLLTKLQDGRWVVIVTSGYNNTSGNGQLYVLLAQTGEILYKISTGAGTASSPSGLREISNYVPSADVDNTTQRVYGGDLLGNIWRFDVNGIYEPAGREASLVARALAPDNSTPQPITTRIQIAEYDGKTILLAGTGKLLGSTDVIDTQVQSIYGFFDTLAPDTSIANLRAVLKPMALTTVGDGATATRTIACTAATTAECNVIGNWYMDLTGSGERVTVDMRLALGTLTFTSNVPESSACSAGGSSWINYVDLLTGNAVSGAGGIVSQKLSDTLSTGLTLFVTSTGVKFISTNAQNRGDTTQIAGTPATGASGNVKIDKTPTSPQKPVGRRISWREITDER